MEKGWYKVKFESEWTCALNDGTDCFSWRLINGFPLDDEDLDEIGEKIAFPSYNENTKTE